ncbi:MAG: HD-GYP domain-containing protein [Desulfobaccales bacterium]
MDESSVRKKLLSLEHKVLKRPLDKVVSSSYTPINLSVLIPRERLTFNLYMKVAQKGCKDSIYILFLHQEEAWDLQWLDLLTQKAIDRLYFLSEDLERVIAYLNNYLQILKHENTNVTPELLAVFSEHLNLSIRLAFQSPRLGKAVQQAHGQVEDLIERLQQDPESLKLVWKVLYHDYNLYNHSINLCLLGTAFMLFLKKSRNETRALGLAGLFHDIGMTRIPQEILVKEGPLTTEERAEINHHPMLGHRLLSKETSLAYMPNEVLRLCLEHHENADGSGYPQGLPLCRQHPCTRIIRLLDSYESITGYRPYHAPYKPFEAIKIVQEAQGPGGPIYERQAIKDFIRFLAHS